MGEKWDATKGFFTEHIISVATDYGKEVAKEGAKELIVDQTAELATTVGIDMISSMIPAIGGAISSFRTQRSINNLKITIDEISKRAEELEENFQKQTKENKKILDDIFDFVLEKSIQTAQQKKIKFMVQGFLKITEVENVSFDVAYLYYDTLERLTLLDLDCLKLSYTVRVPFDGTLNISYEDILEKYDISHDQYISIRENLSRIGLLENQYDESLGKDLKKLTDTVNEIRDSVISTQTALQNPKKKFTTLRKNKLSIKAKDQLKISKFGRQFIQFFIETNEKI
ncbi:hypothetical protein [Desemzia sp. FAM 24101]|uniref:hypothetical protein n=1 Tax=unclassified Desemzia TaxID=2685243 RepID=UPI003888693D